MRYGDRIKAIPGSVTDIFAEGRTGTVKEAKRSDDVYSQNLVQWDGDIILMGFNPNSVEVVNE